LLLRPLHERLSPVGGGTRVDLEDREPAAFADTDPQQADAAGFVIHLLQFDFLPAKRDPEAIEFRDLIHISGALLNRGKLRPQSAMLSLPQRYLLARLPRRLACAQRANPS
jgi:hypothetical protein